MSSSTGISPRGANQRFLWFSRWYDMEGAGPTRRADDMGVLRRKMSPEQLKAHKAFVTGVYRMVTSGVPIPPEDAGGVHILNTKFVHDLGGLAQSAAGPIVSESTKAVLEQFELGHTLFHPIRIMNLEQTREVTTEPYYVLNVCNHKDTPDLAAIFVEEKMPYRTALRDVTEGKGSPVFLFQTHTDDDFIARPEVLSSPDIWIDPRIRQSLFLSDRLAQALRAEGVDDGNWKLVRAIVIAGRA